MSELDNQKPATVAELPPQPHDPLYGFRDKRHEERRVLDRRTGKLVPVPRDPIQEPEFL
jgi:hypothetical protein